MTRLLVALACLSVFGVATAQPVVLDGYTAPVPGAFAQVPVGKEPRLRGAQTVQLGVLPGESLAFSVHCHRVGRYESPLQWRLLDAAGAAVQAGEVPLGGKQDVVVPDAKPGVYALALDAKLNAYSVRSPLRHLTYTAGGKSSLRIIYQVPTLHFWVPAGAKRISVGLRGSGKEQAAYTVRKADGTVLVQGTSLTNGGESEIVVNAANRGQVWSVETTELADYTFEDVAITLGGDLPPAAAEHPSRLLLPMLSAFAQPSGDDACFGIRVNASPDLLAGKKLHYTLQEVGAAKPAIEKTIDDITSGVFTSVLPGPGFVHARISGELLNGDGTVVVHSEAKLAMAHGKRYVEIENVEDGTSAQPSWADIQTGYQVFQRSEPGNIRPNSRPLESELRPELKVRVTPGEFETVYFALQPLRDLPGTEIAIGGFTSETADATVVACDLRTVRCWPQMTDWRSTTFHIVPELLEEHAGMDLQTGVPQQYAAILHVPEDAEPGTYSADVEVISAGRRSRAAKLLVEVLPYKLQNPPGIVWGLYPDSGRWGRFDNSQIKAELKAFKEHGMTALMLYPLGAGKWSWENGTLSVDFSRFRNQMNLYKAAGLGGPMVISIQSSEGFITRLTGYKREEDAEQFWGAYRQMLKLLKQESIDQQWPEYCLHSVDEPHSGPKLEAAIRTLKVIKEFGFETFNTCYGKAVRDALDPYLDYRCYNNIGFLSMRTPEGTEELRKETLASDDAFWWYGTGCYTNGALIQDGNVLVNRFMGGVHFWRTKATGCWAWTFLRPKNSAYDDFDGTGHREGKDACIAYPTPDGKALVPTLQWEGIREGVDDYRYLYTLQSLIREAKQTGKNRAGQLANETEDKLNAMIAAMPWNCRPGGVTNADLDRFRAQVIDWTLALLAVR